jgi:hypothetical protein
MFKRLSTFFLALLIFAASSAADTIYFKPFQENPSVVGGMTITGVNGGNAGIYMNQAVPLSTLSTLYNNNGTLMWNGSIIPTGGSSISGTPTYIPKFTTANSIGDSQLTDTGTTVNLSYLTAGSLLFSGASGAFSQSNADLFWDNTLKGLRIGATSSFTDFPLAKIIGSAGNTGHTYTGNIGTIGEAVSSGTDTATGIGGVGATTGTQSGRGVAGVGKVSASADTGAAIGGYFRSLDTHAGGANVGASVQASGGLANYAISLAGGDISSLTSNPNWLLQDNQATALSFDSAGKTGILAIKTTDGSEGVSFSGNVGLGTPSPQAPLHQIAIPTTTPYTDSSGGSNYPTHLLQINQVLNPTGSSNGFLADYTFDPATYSGTKTISAQKSILTVPATNSTAMSGISNATLQGLSAQANFLGTGALSSLYGNRIDVTTGSAGTGTITSVYGNRTTLTLQGSGGRAINNANAYFVESINVGNTIANAYGLKNQFGNNSGTVGNWYGNHTSLTNSGTITNSYGYYVGDITAGTQTNTPYSFYASDANAYNYFAGKIGIKTTTPGADLDATPTTVTTTTYTRPHPVLTNTQREALTGATAGVGVYNSTSKVIDLYDGSDWTAQKSIATVYVNDVTDLPAAVTGKITLATNTEYVFNPGVQLSLTDELALSNRTRISNANITSTQKISATGSAYFQDSNLAYTGTATMMDISNTTLGSVVRFNAVTLTANNATYISATTTQTAFFIINEMAMLGTGNTLGTNNGWTLSIEKLDLTLAGQLAGGATFTNNKGINIQSIDIPNGMSAPGTLFTFGGTTQGSIQLEKLILNNTGTNVFAYKFDTATTFNSPVSNHNGSITDSTKAFAASSNTQQTVGFKFNNVGNISDSAIMNFSGFENNGTATTVTNDNTVYKVNATWTNVSTERVTFNSNGTFTYVGNENANLNVKAYLTLDPASVSDTTWSTYIYKNNNLVSYSKFKSGIKGGEVLTLMPEARVDASKNDYFEVFVERNVGTGNVTVTDGKIIIEK